MTRTYVVTGAASGIGSATTSRLRQEGHRVIGVDLHDADVTADLSTPQGRTRMADTIADMSGGRIDAVLAIAGLNAPIPATVLVNYFGAVATLDSLRPLIAQSDAPRAAAVTSIASLHPHDDALLEACLSGDEAAALQRAQQLADQGDGYQIYSTSKQALARWIRQNAPTPSWAGAHIPLNAIAPGVVLTPMTADLVHTEQGRKQLTEQVPMPLNGPFKADTAAELLTWLTSPSNSHLCGQVIFLDGGYDALTRTDTTW